MQKSTTLEKKGDLPFPKVNVLRVEAGTVTDGAHIFLSNIRGEQGLRDTKPDGIRDVTNLYRNQVLLEMYLESRRLSPKTRQGFSEAISSFSEIVAVPLEEAGRPEFEAWFRYECARGLAASTILLYTRRLGQLLRFALMSQGLSKREAKTTAAAAMAGVPIEDLRREEQRLSSLRDMLVRPEEFEALITTARHPRVRALIWVLRESACRKGELISLRIRDLGFEPTHAEIRVLGKTGERTIPLVDSVWSLRAWLDVHPDPRPSAPLFATTWKGEVRRMNERTPNNELRELCRRAGVRNITPLMLRHTRLTDLARAGLGEYQLKSFAGWAPDSKMAARYIHLSGRDHIDAILRVEGVKEEEAEAR